MKTIELQIVSNLFSDPDKKGNRRLIKANVITRETYSPEDLEGPFEAVSPKGIVYADVCRVYHKNLGYKTVLATYDEIKNLIVPETIVRGFRRLPEPLINQQQPKAEFKVKPKIKPKKSNDRRTIRTKRTIQKTK